MRPKFHPSFYLIFIFLLGCGQGKNKEVERDSSITILTSFNNLFLDSANLAGFLNRNPGYQRYADQFYNFYKERNYEYAWFDTSGLGEQSHNFINLLNTSISELHDSSLYDATLYKMYNEFHDVAGLKKSSRDALETELRLSGQFFKYAAKVYNGSDVDVTQLGWYIPRKKISLSALLDTTLLTQNDIPASNNLINEGYKKLLPFLNKYYDLQKKGNWFIIPEPEKPIHINETSYLIPKIKTRLFQLGDLSYHDSTDLFDAALLTATKSFQKRMGLSQDGAIGPKMINELNVSPEKRIQQILINLERMRWMPPQPAGDFIFVNIPEYKMYVYENGKLTFSMNVIVGKTGTNTVIFSGNLQYVVFAPYWNVPKSIVENEIVPGMKRDSNYLSNRNMQIIGHDGGLPVVRQNPGGNNSLGRVKFLFPNNYDIYFHDTPNRDLFTATNRSFSHGCIRVGEPKKLAAFLLRNDTFWNSVRIDTAMYAMKEKWVKTATTTPVVIAYFTAWVDNDGLLNFRKDIYQHDKKMADKLFVKQEQK